jgi:chemotaxis signal transduction protein
MSQEGRSANDELAGLVASQGASSGLAAAGSDAPVELSWPYLLIRVGARWFGLRAESVREVVVPEAITRVPAQPRHVLGVCLVHGRLVPTIAIGPLMPATEVTLERPPGRRLAVISHEDSEIGLVADEAQGVIYLPAISEHQPSADRPRFIAGEVRWQDHLVCLLDAQRLLVAAIGATGA